MSNNVNSKMHFISGLPRSGSTLLAAILRQNPKFRAGMTTPVYPMVMAINHAMGAHTEGHTTVTQEQRIAVQRGVIENFYAKDIADDATVFDTNRQWTSRMPLLSQLWPEAKVICCVRDVAWILDSFERSLQKDPSLHSRLFTGDDGLNVYTRCEALVDGKRQIGTAWNALREAYYGPHSANLMLIELDALTYNPEAIIAEVYKFIDEEPFEHTFDNVQYSAPNYDAEIGLPDLHKVEGKVEYRTRQPILPPDLFQKYSNSTFWRKDLKTKAKVFFVQAE